MKQKDRWILATFIALIVYIVALQVRIVRLEQKMTVAVENIGMITDIITTK